MIQSERAPSDNNIPSVGNTLGVNMLNGSPMCGDHTSTKQPGTGNKMTHSNTHRNSHEQEYSYSSATHNNTGGGWLWNCSALSGNPLEIHIVKVDGNRAQSSTPHGMSQSESAPSGNNITSAGNTPGINLLNGSPMLGNPTSTKKTKNRQR